MMSRTPQASVILTSHARPHYVGAAVRSILRQSCTAWELIIVDNGEHAAVRRVLQPFVARDQRVRLLYGRHANVSEAANAGLRVARAPWVTFQDDDDVSHRHRLKACLRLVEARPDVSGVLPQVEVFYDRTARTLQRRRFVSHLKQGLLRRADLIAAGGFRSFFPLTEDTDLLLRLQERGCGFYELTKVLYYYRHYDGAQHLSHRLDRARYHLAVHISAWHRAAKRADPIDQKGASLDSVLAKLAEMPIEERMDLMDRSLFSTYAEQLELCWQSGDDARRDRIFADLETAMRQSGFSAAEIRRRMRGWRASVGAWAGGIHDFARALAAAASAGAARGTEPGVGAFRNVEEIFQRARQLSAPQRDGLVRRFLLKACKARAVQCLLDRNSALLRRVRADTRLMLQQCGYGAWEVRRHLLQFTLSVHMRHLRQRLSLWRS